MPGNRALLAALIALLVGANGFVPHPALAADGTCAGRILDRLKALGIEEADRSDVSFETVREPQTGVVQDRLTWVRLESCNGYAVARLGRGCAILELYTIGQCRIAGIPDY